MIALEGIIFALVKLAMLILEILTVLTVKILPVIF
jgi:hypothetical protein